MLFLFFKDFKDFFNKMSHWDEFLSPLLESKKNSAEILIGIIQYV